jgi:hypothetical protein
VKATTEGVVRLPSEFSNTTGSPPSITAMQELVVPRSIPITLAIKIHLPHSNDNASHAEVMYIIDFKQLTNNAVRFRHKLSET